MKIKKDQIIILTLGWYDDYRIAAIVIATKDFDTEVEKANFLFQYPYSDSDDELFIAWLKDNNLVIQLLDDECVEWNLPE